MSYFVQVGEPAPIVDSVTTTACYCTLAPGGCEHCGVVWHAINDAYGNVSIHERHNEISMWDVTILDGLEDDDYNTDEYGAI